MGKARISIAWELLRQSLQIPEEWRLVTVYVETKPYAPNSAQQTLRLIVEGENIEQQDVPLELRGTFKQKTIDGQDGRWIQGHWEIFR